MIAVNKLYGGERDMRSKAITLSMAGVLLLSGMVVGSSAVAATTKPSDASGKPVTISFWYSTVQPAPVMNFLVRQFEKSHKGVIVKAEQVSEADSYVKYTTAMAAGGGPDVVMTDGYGHIMVWAADNLTQPLNKYIRAYHLHLPAYYTPIEEAMRHDGRIYGLPQEVDEPMLLYNKKLFAKAGLNPNDPPQTLTQLEADIKKLTIIHGGKIVQAGLIPSQRWGNNIWPKYFGGGWFSEKTQSFTVDTPQNIAAFKALVTLYKMQGGYSQASAFVSSAKFGNPFFTGQEAMEIGGEWVPGEIQAEVPHLDYGVAPVPVGPGYKPGSLTFVSPGNFFVLPRRITHQRAAVEFLVWMDSAYADNYFNTKAGNLDPAISGSTSTSAFYRNNPVLQPWLKELHNAGNSVTHDVSITPVYSYWETTRPTYEEEILTGKVTPTAGLAALQSNISQYQKQFDLTHPGW